VTPGQPLGVSPIGLDPIPSLDRRQGRRDDRALYAQLAQLPVENIGRWTGLIAGTQLLNCTQLPYQLAKRFCPVGDYAKTPNLTIRFGYCHCDRIGMDIHAQKSYLVLHDPAPLRLWL